LITDALQLARERGFREALVNITAMTGFDSPGSAYRRWITRRWAKTVEGTVRVVLVAKREHISPQKVGLLVRPKKGWTPSSANGKRTQSTGWTPDAGSIPRRMERRKRSPTPSESPGGNDRPTQP
jgi:hypothetical protein